MKELSIYEKEFDINLGKINTFFEYAFGVYAAESALYSESVIYEGAAEVKEKIKKTFDAIIKAIREFINKCIASIREKMAEAKLKKGFKEFNKIKKEQLKDMVKRGTMSKTAAKNIMKLIKNAEDAYVKISRLTEKYTAAILNSSSISEANEIFSKYEKECDSILKSEQIAADVTVFSNYTSSDWQSIGIYCDMSIIEDNNKRLAAIMEDADKHVRNLLLQAESKVDDAEIDESGTANEKISVIQKITAKFSEFVKKISSFLTRITINIMNGIAFFLKENRITKGIETIDQIAAERRSTVYNSRAKN